MTYKNIEKQKAAQKNHYLANKELFADRVIQRRKLAFALVETYKQFNSCLKCNIKDIWCLEFHHRNPNQKLKNICQLCQDGASPITIFSEIKKCDILCANCHRIHHRINQVLKDTEECSEATLRRRIRIKWFQEYRQNLQCNHCGFSNPLCLDFHHKNPKEKIWGVSEMVSFAYSEKRILEEIEKCEVLCANCHAKVTKEIRNGH